MKTDEQLRDELAEKAVRGKNGQFCTMADWDAADLWKQGWLAARANPPRERPAWPESITNTGWPHEKALRDRIEELEKEITRLKAEPTREQVAELVEAIETCLDKRFLRDTSMLASSPAQNGAVYDIQAILKKALAPFAEKGGSDE